MEFKLRNRSWYSALWKVRRLSLYTGDLVWIYRYIVQGFKEDGCRNLSTWIQYRYSRSFSASTVGTLGWSGSRLGLPATALLKFSVTPSSSQLTSFSRETNYIIAGNRNYRNNITRLLSTGKIAHITIFIERGRVYSRHRLYMHGPGPERSLLVKD